LLDESGDGAAMKHIGKKNPSHKQLSWEENRTKRKWQKKKRPFKAGYKAKYKVNVNKNKRHK